MIIPVIHMDHRKASDAYAVHSALLRAERANPELRENPQWTILRQDAFERFSEAFKVIAQ